MLYSVGAVFDPGVAFKATLKGRLPQYAHCIDSNLDKNWMGLGRPERIVCKILRIV